MLARIAAKFFFDQLGQNKNYRILSNIKDVIAECAMWKGDGLFFLGKKRA
jgi:hypothetical protein